MRGVYAAVRDRNWETVAPVISDLVADIAADRFTIGFTADCLASDVHFRWQGRLEGDADGRIRYDFAGRAITPLESNRIGFCVLHPLAGVAGRRCRVEHVDGTIEEGRFPAAIAPHQPFLDVRSISHEAAGAEATVRMTGDTFETEDQRNWTDASFKTYCRPLRLPFPFSLAAGEAVRQSVEIAVSGDHVGPVGVESSIATLDLLPTTGRFPAVGIGLAPDLPPPGAVEHLRRLRPRHLRVDLRLALAGWADRLQAADGLARSVGAPLEVAVHMGDEPETELTALAARLQAMSSAVARVLVFRAGEKSTASRWAPIARRLLDPALPGCRIGLGTDAFFAELNRDRPDPSTVDLLAFSVNPQVHAFDDASIMETIEAQTEAVRSARAIAGGKGVAVSPVTLRMRWNPNATVPLPPDAALAAACDPRQATPFAAAWTVGSLRGLAAGGVEAVTFYETHGPRGLMDGGGPYPAFHVLADVCEAGDAAFVPTTSSRPLELDGLGLASAGLLRLLVANLLPTRRGVRCRGLPPGRRFAVRILEEATAPRAAVDPVGFRTTVAHHLAADSTGGIDLELGPHAVATLDEMNSDAATDEPGETRPGARPSHEPPFSGLGPAAPSPQS